MSNNKILSYKDWLTTTIDSSSLQDPYSSYLEYISGWYDATFYGKSTAELTADEYRHFLLSLNVVTSNRDISSHLENLDFSNPRELQTAIPFFSGNLKGIAKYISERRDAAKNDNLDSSFSNSTIGVEREIYKTLLALFLADNNAKSNEELDALLHGITVEVEELYDDNEYLDKSPNAPASDYFDMESNKAFFSEYDPDYLNWIVESGFNELISNNDNINPPASGDLELSEYINYVDDSEQTTHFRGKLASEIMGEQHHYLSGGELCDFSDANHPWNNISNRYHPTIANFPLMDSLYSKYDVGGFFIPSKLALPVALGLNKYSKKSDVNMVVGKDNFPNPSRYSNGFGFTGALQDSPIIYNSYLNWIDVKQISGKGRGILTSNGRYQEMSPYQTSYETTSVTSIGMNQIGDVRDPWHSKLDDVWRDDVNYPPDFRNLYDIDGWYADNTSLTGHEDNWAIDIYGNNYGLYKDTDSESILDRMSDSSGKLYVRGLDDKLLSYINFFKESSLEVLDGFKIDELRFMNVYNDLLIMEDVDGTLIIQKIIFEDDIYKMDGEISLTTLDFEDEVGDYQTFGHHFDDRDGSLYFGRYEAIIDGSVEIILYRHHMDILKKVFDTKDHRYDDIEAIRDNYTFTQIGNFPSITISPLDDKLSLTYIGGTSSKHIVIIPLLISGGYSLDEVVVVQPEEVEEYDSDEGVTLVDTIISSDKLVLLLEGADSNGKYLQVIPL